MMSRLFVCVFSFTAPEVGFQKDGDKYLTLCAPFRHKSNLTANKLSLCIFCLSEYFVFFCLIIYLLRHLQIQILYICKDVYLDIFVCLYIHSVTSDFQYLCRVLINAHIIIDNRVYIILGDVILLSFSFKYTKNVI